MNKVTEVGRLTKDVELRFSKGKGEPFCNFTVAVDRYEGKNNAKSADFIPCVAFGKRAEALCKCTSRGSLISLVGNIKTSSYDGADGSKKYRLVIVAEDIQFLSKSTNNNSDNSNGYNNNNNNNNGYNNNNNHSNNNDSFGGFDDDMTPVDDSDMPF